MEKDDFLGMTTRIIDGEMYIKDNIRLSVVNVQNNKGQQVLEERCII